MTTRKGAPSNDASLVRDAFRTAERDAHPDPSRLVAAVPRLMREARRRPRNDAASAPALFPLAVRLLPRLAAATAAAVVAAIAFSGWNRLEGSAKSTAFESAILGASDDETGDVLWDALLSLERNDG